MPHMIVTETHLLCALTDQSMDQEHFVSEVGFLTQFTGGLNVCTLLQSNASVI